MSVLAVKKRSNIIRNNKIENKNGTLIIKSKQKSRRVFSKEV